MATVASEDWIAARVSPATDPRLARRARALARPRHRRRLAATLRRFVSEAHDPLAPLWTASPPLARAEIRTHRALLWRVADRLADARPATPHGLALAHLLVTSPSSPLYPPSPRGLLARVAGETLRALDET
jgi:hypothetical protein